MHIAPIRNAVKFDKHIYLNKFELYQKQKRNGRNPTSNNPNSTFGRHVLVNKKKITDKEKVNFCSYS